MTGSTLDTDALGTNRRFYERRGFTQATEIILRADQPPGGYGSEGHDTHVSWRPKGKRATQPVVDSTTRIRIAWPARCIRNITWP